MGIKTGHLVYGAVMLAPEEEKLLENRVKEVNAQFPESKISINNFLDVALRVGIDVELSSIRKRLEADRHVKYDADCGQAECSTGTVYPVDAGRKILPG